MNISLEQAEMAVRAAKEKARGAGQYGTEQMAQIAIFIARMLNCHV